MDLIDKYFPVLDKGFIALKGFMGGDEDIEQAARVSYGKGTRKVSETRGLIRYLIRHRHTTPMEMVELKFHIRMPMDCHRQMIRHRTASVNEYSTRYSEAIDGCQQTSPEEWRLQSGSNKQGSKDGYVGFPEGWWSSPAELIAHGGGTAGEYLTCMEKNLQSSARRVYNERLKFGIAREQARKDLPLSNYTEYYWKSNLHNIFHFLKLRCDSHAQKEIRDYAVIMAGIVKEIVPLAFEAWYDYAFQAVNFTRLDRVLLNRYNFRAWDVTEKDKKILLGIGKDIGMNKREIDEFLIKISEPKEQDFTLDLSKVEGF